MDGFTEKKWFVYIGDKHEGPFSLEEIQGQMTQGRVSGESYVWADGMADWKAMPEVPDFTPLLRSRSAGETQPQSPPPPDPIEKSEAPAFPQTEAPAAEQPQMAMPVLEVKTELRVDSSLGGEEKTGDLDAEELKRVQEVAAQGADFQVEDSTKARKNRKQALLISAAIILVVLAGIYKTGYLSRFSEELNPFLVALGEKVPFLDQWVSPIPALDDVSAQEYAELQMTAKTKLAPGTGAQVALALSRSDLLAPSFYLATNIQEPIAFHVYVVGVSDTLLNQNSFLGELDVKVTKKLGKTIAVRMNDGQLIPRGEYGIYVVAAENQPASIRAILATTQPLVIKTPSEMPRDAKVLAYKSVFLGGSRDAMYTSRLKDFHDKLRTKAANELGEVRQFVGTLESQFSSTTTKFDLLKKMKSSGRTKKQWEDFHSKWMELQEQMDQIFRKWTPEALSQEYFYGMLYQLVQQAGISVQKVHEFHHSYFVGVSDQKTFEIQMGEATSSAVNALTLLKSKVEQAEKLSPTPNGMPRRDEL